MDAAALNALLAQAKTAPNWAGWTERSNHSGHFLNVAPLLDATGVTLPGITVELEVKAASLAGVCFYLFTLMESRARVRSRIYQLEVVPSWKRSHSGLTTIHGPHEHLLSDEPLPVSDPGVNCGSWLTSAQWFFARTGIAMPQVTDPFAP